MLRGTRAGDDEARIFDGCLTLHAEHGFNASTFAARCTASTLSDLYSSITTAIGTLKGPLHGGANTAVMETLLEIGDIDNVESWLETALAEKRKIMGFGHRVYKVDDPRGTILRRFSREIGQQMGEPKWSDLSEALAKGVRKRKSLIINVDFYSASTYYSLGIPPDLYTTLFAFARLPGWVAHVLDQYRNNRLIRPKAAYGGPAPRDYVPLDQRG
jgi:2-methylcitrate synthase